MWCFVSQPNSVVLEVEVDQKADGQECLDQICQQLGIIEVDYFGLQFLGNKGERLWLNLRNRIDEQLAGPPPYRLQLRVKFFVKPHLLLQTTSRHQVYLHVRQEVQCGRLEPVDRDQAVQLAALIAQADYGDSERMNIANLSALYKTLLHPAVTSCDGFCQAVNDAHQALRGLSADFSEYRVLGITSDLANYGVEDHVAKSLDPVAVNIRIGVGPEGILLQYEDRTESQRIEYPMIKEATHAGKCLFLTIINSSLNGEDTVLGFRLVSHRAANALYRCVTEMHSFYRCDTVRNVVLDQFSRDLKGMLASLFNENTSLGKKYVFDIRRTCREVYDHTRRVLYARGLNPLVQPQQELQRGTQRTDQPQSTRQNNLNECAAQSQCKVLQEKLDSLQDALVCRVCMDAGMDTVLCPCGHIVCCSSCAHYLETCPVCRAPIEQVQAVFLPIFPTLSQSPTADHSMTFDTSNAAGVPDANATSSDG